MTTADKAPRHFPVTTQTAMDLETWTAKPTRYFALCGYESENAKEFVIPWSYKPEQVTCPGCRKQKAEET